MTTVWTYPNTFSQYAEEGGEDVHVRWNENNFKTLCTIGTEGSLTHIARSPKHDTTSRTYYLKAQGFNFSSIPETVSIATIIRSSV